MADYRDTCPECARRDVPPTAGLCQHAMVSCQYECPACGYAWGCCWEVVDGWVIPATVLIAPVVAPVAPVDHDRGWDRNAWTAQPRPASTTAPRSVS